MTHHKPEEMKGRVEEAAGDLTGNKDLKREGQVDQASAKTKSAIDEAADAVKKVVSPDK